MTTRRRIALFVPDLQGGGAERIMVSLANSFSAAFDVDLVLQQAAGPYLSEVDPRVRIMDLKARRLVSSLFPLTRYFRRAKPDAMLATPSAANLIAVTAWIAAGSPGRLVVREAITASVDDAFSTGLRARVVAALRRRAYEASSQVVAPSIGVADDLIQNIGIAPDHIRVIANPVETDRILTLASAPIDGPSLPPNTRMILGVGRLFAQKDFATLLRAFATLAEKRNLILVILGDGEERARLTRLVAELGVQHRVFMPGFASNPFAYMKRAAAFVLSSLYEGYPNALLQALVVGAPAVATDCPSGPREILEGGRWGRLVPVGDADAMATAISDAIDGRLAAPPVSLMNERYGVDSIARQYLDVLLGDAARAADGSARETVEERLAVH